MPRVEMRDMVVILPGSIPNVQNYQIAKAPLR
jgi:hypothetical protein